MTSFFFFNSKESERERERERGFSVLSFLVNDQSGRSVSERFWLLCLVFLCNIYCSSEKHTHHTAISRTKFQMPVGSLRAWYSVGTFAELPQLFLSFFFFSPPFLVFFFVCLLCGVFGFAVIKSVIVAKKAVHSFL